MASPQVRIERLQQLLEASKAGDEASFRALYQVTSSHLLGVALRILGDRQSAEDVLQESYVSIWRNAAKFQSELPGLSLSPMTWLITIVRNRALDVLRARGRRSEFALDSESGEGNEDGGPVHPSAAELFDQATEARQINLCMQGVAAQHRQALALCYYQGFSHQEIAEHLAAPLGSVKAWVRRGLQKLRDCLDHQGWTA